MPLELNIIRATEFIRVGAHGQFDLAASKAALATLAGACRKPGIQQALLDLRALQPGPKPVFTPAGEKVQARPRAAPAFENAVPESRHNPVRIHSGQDKPANAFAAVRYREHWFWVDDGDWQTKRALTAVMFFFTLAETGGSEKLPLITIPAQ